MLKLFLILFVTGAVVATPPPANINDDPYVKLYQVRLEIARAAVAREFALVEVNRARNQMTLILYQRNATSREEMLIRKGELDMSVATYEASQLRVKEMEEVLVVVKFLRQAGRDVPLFPGGN